MNAKQMKRLLRRYREGSCTEAEKELVLSWYRQLGPDEGVELPEEAAADVDTYIHSHYEAFLQRADAAAEKEETGTPVRRLTPWWWAAAAVMLLLIGGASYYLLHRERTETSVIAVAKDIHSNDWLRLPDGSVVVLKPGSRLSYDSSSFEKQYREVTLHGEAYFDVVHKERSPFVVHAGNIRTTVLGTAFTISTGTDGKTVSVSVTRGKVKVEDMQQHRTLAVLTKGKAVDYTAPSSTGNKVPAVPAVRNFPVEEAIQWVAADLQFESLPFSVVAERLSVRYHTAIRLAHPDIGNCIISMTAPFEGTESLEQVLTVLCGTLNDTYRVTDMGILIEGTGCPSR